MIFTFKNATDWSSVSKSPTVAVTSGAAQVVGNKPKGVWYALGPAWINFVMSGFKQKKADNILEIELNPSTMIIIHDPKKFAEFCKIYGVKDKYGEDKIDWGKVATKYAGIEISPVFFQFRKLDWYFPWDVPSGCIWEQRALKSFKAVAKSHGKNDYFEVL